MVPRLDADPLVDALALHVSAGRVPVRATASTRTDRALEARPGVRAARHRDLRRRTATGRSRRTTPRRRRTTCCFASRVRNAGPEPASIDVLPTLWFRNTWSWGDGHPEAVDRDSAEGRLAVAQHRGARCAASCSVERRRPHAAVLRQRDERRANLRRRRVAAVPEGRHQRPRRRGRGDREPRADRHQGGLPATTSTVAAGETVVVELRLSEHDGRSRRRLRAGARRPGARGRRVLRRADACGMRRGRGDSPPPGVGGNALVEAVLPLRRPPLARRRPGAAAPARRAADGPKRPLAPPRQHGRDLDAGHLGVPLVRGLGPRVPLRRARPRRPGVREGAAAAALPRVVHAPERAAARLRVGARRRQPAGARLGGAARVRDRRLAGHRLPRAHLPQAAAQLHLVGQPQGRRGPQRVRGRLPRARQHRPVQPLGAAGRRGSSSSPTAPRGWRCTA